MNPQDLALLKQYKKEAATKVRDLKKRLGLTAIYCIDFETYWADDYSLGKMATTEYVMGSRFKAHMVSVQRDTWDQPRIMSPKQFIAWCKSTDWTRAGMLAHNTHFDGLIASHVFKIHPKLYLDTLSMARPIMPVTVGGSLDKISKAFGFTGKDGAEVLVNTKGKVNLTPEEYQAMSKYAGVDAELCWGIFYKLVQFTPPAEIRLIHTTTKMYCQPKLLIDKDTVDQLRTDTLAGKESELKLLSVAIGREITKEQIVSDKQFVALANSFGFELPIKVSPRTGKQTFALAKGDLAFKDLLKSKEPILRQMVQTRLSLKTSIVETRSARMSNRSEYGAQPIYLNYWGAKTGRWSGGDRANWQNLGRGSPLRTAIHAAPGRMLVIADQSQIEARINAWVAYQQDVVDIFASGEDVYCHAASKIYRRTITKADKQERFVGKVATLALGYGAGAARFAEMLRLGAYGPPIDISDDEARDIVNVWRQANNRIVMNWKTVQNNAKSAFLGKQELHDEVLTYRGENDTGLTILPDDTYIRYDRLRFDENNEMSYCNEFRRLKDGTIREGRQKLYGGLLVENNTQALARSIIASNMLSLEDAMPYAQVVMSTHDEIVLELPASKAAKALKITQEIMRAPPAWAPDLPLDVEAHTSERYDK